MPRKLVPVGAAVLALSACTGDGETLSEKKLPQLVLQPRDAPAFLRFDEGQQLRADAPPGRRADPGRFDRRGGWKARYRRAGSATTRGPLVIESRADVFASEGGAQQDFDALREELEVPGTRRLEIPEIGEESVASQLTQPAATPIVFFTIGWRRANVTASVVVQGFAGRTTLEDAVALARKQERRIDEAAR